MAMTLWESLTKHLSEGTEETHEDTQNSRYHEAIFEPSTWQTRSMSITHSTAAFNKFLINSNVQYLMKRCTC
jgi:hypothetical protein